MDSGTNADRSGDHRKAVVVISFLLWDGSTLCYSRALGGLRREWFPLTRSLQDKH